MFLKSLKIVICCGFAEVLSLGRRLFGKFITNCLVSKSALALMAVAAFAGPPLGGKAITDSRTKLQIIQILITTIIFFWAQLEPEIQFLHSAKMWLESGSSLYLCCHKFPFSNFKFLLGSKGCASPVRFARVVSIPCAKSLKFAIRLPLIIVDLKNLKNYHDNINNPKIFK